MGHGRNLYSHIFLLIQLNQDIFGWRQITVKFERFCVHGELNGLKGETVKSGSSSIKVTLIYRQAISTSKT